MREMSGQPPLDAVVLAGAPNDRRLAEVSAEEWEALIDLLGKPLVRYPVEALLAAKKVGRVVVVGPESELGRALAGLGVDIVPPAGGMLENAVAGARHLAAAGDRADLVLISTGDIPLITPEVVDSLVEACLDLGGDLFYPVVERSVMEERFPATKRTYGTLRDGTFTGANLFVVNPAVLEREVQTAMALIQARKNPLRMAQVLGLSFLVKLVLGRLSIAELEEHVGRTFSVRARAVVMPTPEIGVDVDKPQDLALVADVLREDAPRP